MYICIQFILMENIKVIDSDLKLLVFNSVCEIGERLDESIEEGELQYRDR